MKALLIVILSSFMFYAHSTELDASDLETLSECDYFKYTSCTGAKLTVGACVKEKYDKFVKACGKVHADKFIYSREMFKPSIDPSKKKASCEAAQSKLCGKSGLSLGQCASKYKKELSESCDKEYMAAATSKAVLKIDECMSLRKKMCGDEADPDCDDRFQAKAPSLCKTVAPKTKSGVEGSPSEAKLLGDCMGAIQANCKLDEEELMKDGVDVNEYLKKFQECTKRALKKATGKCGQHFETESKIKEAQK
ncbi:MAG: hypothetical protein ACJAT2_000467 [Bacteriovoracaceae bacterium]|jgi:hypothetical protein